MSIGVKKLWCELHYTTQLDFFLSCCGVCAMWCTCDGGGGFNEKQKNVSLCDFSYLVQITIALNEQSSMTLTNGIHHSTFKIIHLEWRIVFSCTLFSFQKVNRKKILWIFYLKNNNISLFSTNCCALHS